MEFSFKITTLLLTLLLTGLTAGLCFTWSNAVTPGIGKLTDLGYLQSFQEMNRAILNPLFMVVFMGPVVGHVANIFLFKSASKEVFFMLLLAAILYVAGLALVTIFGNVPLNELLDRSDLLTLNTDELTSLRAQFENKWNLFHTIRTCSTFLSFALLILSQALYLKNSITL